VNDTELRDLFHGLTARMERFETRMDALEKSLADFRVEVRGRFEGLESRLALKADAWTVSIWGGTLAGLIAVATAVATAAVVRYR
jgi:hypothetical protein